MGCATSASAASSRRHLRSSGRARSPPVPGHTRTEAEAGAYRAEHREQVLRVVESYNPDVVVALDVDFGHTSPQWVLPMEAA